MIILGIDPGLSSTGYGFIEAQEGRLRLIAAGDIRPQRQGPLPERLAYLCDVLTEHIRCYKPEVAVLERIFIHYRHVTTAAKMAHARGAICLAVQRFDLDLIEYLPTRVKHAVTGRGNASKSQMAMMVEQWLGVREEGWSFDATDALGLAIAHAHILAAPVGMKG